MSKVMQISLFGAVCLITGMGSLSCSSSEDKKGDDVEEARFKLKIEGVIASAQEQLDSSEITSAANSLARVKKLDVKGEYASQIEALEAELEKQVAALQQKRDEEAKHVEDSFFEQLGQENVTKAASLLEQFKVLGQSSEKSAELESELVKIQQHLAKREATLARFKQGVSSWDLKSAEVAIAELQSLGIASERLKSFSGELATAKQHAESIEKVISHLKQRDTGKYSLELDHLATSWKQRFPKHPELGELQKKIVAYPQIVRVPSDLPSLDEAIKILRKDGVIELGEGNFYAELSITKPVVIRGAGKGKTIIESRTSNGPAFKFEHEGAESHLVGVYIKGLRGDVMDVAHPLLLVSGGKVLLEKCDVSYSAGHGVAVTKGELKVSYCSVFDNAWDGISIHGRNSIARIENSKVQLNGEHGVDFWAGARGVVSDSEILENSKSGIVVTDQGSALSVIKTQSTLNRGAGFFVSKQAWMKCRSAVSAENMYSGFVLNDAGSTLDIENVQSRGNFEFGFLVNSAAKLAHSKPLEGSNNQMGLVKMQK